MSTLTDYQHKSAWLIDRLMADFGLRDYQAAAICGNGWAESNLKPVLENDGIVTTATRGIGWFQWTGPRHRSFLIWCDGARMDWRSDAAEYGFLKYELGTDYADVIAKLKRTTNIQDAVACFEKYYEGAGIVAMARRTSGAVIAIDAWRASHQTTPGDGQ